MYSGLLVSLNQFRTHFNYELERLGISLLPGNEVLTSRNWQQYAANCTALLEGQKYRPVRGIYLWIEEDREDSQLLKLSEEEKTCSAAPWPSGLKEIQNRHPNRRRAHLWIHSRGYAEDGSHPRWRNRTLFG